MREYGLIRRIGAANFAAAVLICGLVALLGASRAEAANGTCEKVGAGYHCHYNEGSVAPYQTVWFDSGGENLRRWETNEAWDYYASHIAKCAGLKRYDGTYFPTPSCGNAQNQGIFLNASWRPGWAYVFQYASGARLLYGDAWQE